jgi:hypothetical protein
MGPSLPLSSYTPCMVNQPPSAADPSQEPEPQPVLRPDGTPAILAIPSPDYSSFEQQQVIELFKAIMVAKDPLYAMTLGRPDPEGSGEEAEVELEDEITETQMRTHHSQGAFVIPIEVVLTGDYDAFAIAMESMADEALESGMSTVRQQLDEEIDGEVKFSGSWYDTLTELLSGDGPRMFNDEGELVGLRGLPQWAQQAIPAEMQQWSDEQRQKFLALVNQRREEVMADARERDLRLR